MIKIIILLSLSLLLFASDTLLYGSQKNDKKKDTIKYTVQIFTAKTQKTAKKITKKVPQNLRKDLHLYKIGKYIAIRYSSANSANDLISAVKKFKNLCCSDAYIIKTSQFRMNRSIVDASVQKEQIKRREEAGAQKTLPKEQTATKEVIQIQHTLNKYTRSNMIRKAAKAYQSGDESTAMLYYEMIVNSGSATRNVKNNLCYLYGKRGAWPEAKKIIDDEKYASKLIYAYAYGAIQTNQDNFSSDFAEYIMMDKSGRLALLAGYYFEQREDWERAEGYYKMSYEKNPSDVYNIFAYARVLDIKDEKEQAIKFYKKIIHISNRHNKYYASIQRRISQLQE